MSRRFDVVAPQRAFIHAMPGEFVQSCYSGVPRETLPVMKVRSIDETRAQCEFVSCAARPDLVGQVVPLDRTNDMRVVVQHVAVTRYAYVNVYDTARTARARPTREVADLQAGPGRIAVLKLTFVDDELVDFRREKVQSGLTAGSASAENKATDGAARPQTLAAQPGAGAPAADSAFATSRHRLFGVSAGKLFNLD